MGLSDLLAVRSSTNDVSSVASTSTSSTSLVVGVGTISVLTTGGRLALIFLIFLSASSLVVLATSTLEAALVADYFAIVTLVLRPGFVAPLAAGGFTTT
jgi:hypothetical protein